MRKNNLLINGEGKYHGYNFYRVAGVDMGVKGIGKGIMKSLRWI